ncbi:MAG: low temperature requirement protein A [Cyanobacteria bacterium J06621_11]
MTIVIMGGALVIAAGIDIFFAEANLTLVVIGYVIMRLAMVVLWLRAAGSDSAGRQTALWCAGGIAIAQAYWVALLFSQIEPGILFCTLVILGAVLELAVPVFLWRASQY